MKNMLNKENLDLNAVKNMLWGHYAGDVMGSIVEFKKDTEISKTFGKSGVTDICHSLTWSTYLGQGTDDSEMTIILFNYLLLLGDDKEKFDINDLKNLYKEWLDSKPFDVGSTTAYGIEGTMINGSLSNGALMRIAPLAIWTFDMNDIDTHYYVSEVVRITHDSYRVLIICMFYIDFLKNILRKDRPIDFSLNSFLKSYLKKYQEDDYILGLCNGVIQSYYKNMGFIETAFKNMCFMLGNYNNYRDIILSTINKGGDTDTNAAIVGAVAGALFGGIPENWLVPCKNWWKKMHKFEILNNFLSTGITRPLKYTPQIYCKAFGE